MLFLEGYRTYKSAAERYNGLASRKLAPVLRKEQMKNGKGKQEIQAAAAEGAVQLLYRSDRLGAELLEVRKEHRIDARGSYCIQEKQNL